MPMARIFFYKSIILVCLLIKLCCSKFIDPMRHDVVLITGKNFDSVLNRQRQASGVTALLHYSEKVKSHEKFIKDVYNEVAKDLKGMIKFLAVDCAEWITFCNETQKSPELKFPTVMVYSPNVLLPPQVLEPTPKKDLISKTVLKYVPGDKITTITKETIDKFVSENPAIPKVLLFSSKQSVPVLFKALSNSFTDRVNFGFIAPSEIELDKKYNVSQRPVILRLRASAKKPEIYKGDMAYSGLHDWINVYAETFVKGGGFSGDDNLSQTPKKLWILEKVPEITLLSYQDVCIRSASSLCMIYLTNGYITKEELDMLHKLADQFPDNANRGAKFRWGWMNLQIEKAYADLFHVSDSRLPSFVALNPHKRLRYLGLPENQKATLESIKALVEKIVYGDGRFTVIKGQKLPSFTPREVTTPAPAKKTEL